MVIIIADHAINISVAYVRNVRKASNVIVGASPMTKLLNGLPNVAFYSKLQQKQIIHNSIKQRMNKIKELNDWLDANPNKTERDWLLEARCKNEQQREDLKRVFAWIDEANSNSDERKHVELEICPYPLRVTDHHTMPEGYPSVIDVIGYGEPKEDVEIFFDFSVGRFFYDLETPEEIYSIPSSPNYNAPAFKTRKYFEWKAEQLGLKNTNFVIRAIECGKHGSGIYDFPPHWKTLPDLYPNK